jgi:hypothetical protein
MRDIPGGQSFLEVIGIGHALQVRADAAIYQVPSAGVGTVLMDHQFAAPPLPPLTVDNGTAALTPATTVPEIVGYDNPLQVSNVTTRTVTTPADTRVGDTVWVAHGGISTTTTPLELQQPPWEQVKARNTTGNCFWMLYRKTATAAGAESIVLSTTAVQTTTTFVLVTRNHGAAVLSAPTEGPTEPPPSLPGVAASGAGRRVSLAICRVAATTTRATTTGATRYATTDPSANSAIQWVMTDDRETAAGAAKPVSITWPPGGTRGGGGITLFLPDGSNPTGGQLQLRPTDASRAVTLDFPPGVPEPVGGNPAAWDTIPTPLPGQTWVGRVTVTLPAAFMGWNGWVAQAWPIEYAAPWSAPIAHPTALPTNGADGPYVPTPGRWQGIRVRVYPTGPAWSDLPAGAWSALGATPAWQDLSTFLVDNVKLVAPPAGAQRSALVFSGRVTDMEARFDGDATLVDITAQDQRAELANRDVGDEPWLSEQLQLRVQRIIALSGQAIAYQIDATMRTVPVSWRDVDRQGAMTLLQEMAISGDGVLWCAAHLTTGPYLYFESLNERPALAGLSQSSVTGIVTIGPVQDVSDMIPLNACELSRDPVRWVQDVADVATRVAVTWRDQTLEGGLPAPTDRVEQVTDPLLEKTVGSRRIAVSTQLANGGNAQTLASNILGRTSTPGWRLNGLTWEAEANTPMDSDQLGRMLTLLDSTTRNGAPILVTDLPSWSPLPDRSEIPLFVEGGVYTSHGGAWQLDMTTSAPTAAGASATWNDMPSTPHPVTAWRWQDFHPDIRWVDLSGVKVI